MKFAGATCKLLQSLKFNCKKDSCFETIQHSQEQEFLNGKDDIFRFYSKNLLQKREERLL
jgi:hypothetical protein